MALDPSIILGVKPPPQVNFIDALSKVAALRDTQSQTALRTQQAQEAQGKYEREQQQNAEADRAAAAQVEVGKQLAANTTTDAQGNLVTDYNTAAKNVAAQGHGKEAKDLLTQGRVDEATRIKNQKDQIDTLGKKVGLVADKAQSLLSLPDSALAPEYDKSLAEFQQQGLIQPGQMPNSTQIRQQAGGDPAALRQRIQQVGMQATQSKDQADIHQKDLDYALKVNELHQNVPEGKHRRRKRTGLTTPRRCLNQRKLRINGTRVSRTSCKPVHRFAWRCSSAERSTRIVRPKWA